MRRPVLLRTVVAVAALGLASAALAAPGTAAAPSGVTRDLILSAAQGLRTSTPTEAQKDALAELVRLRCGTAPSPEDVTWPGPLYVAGGVDGVLVTTQSREPTYRQCTFVALTTTDPSAAMGGTITLTQKPLNSQPDDVGTPLLTETVSGGVFVTGPVPVTYGEVHATASGATTRTVDVATTTKVKNTTSPAQRRAAKKAYAAKRASLKASYKRALVKAGRSASKKAAAKARYVRKRAAARARYRAAVAPYRVVTGTRTDTESRPFDAAGLVYSLILFG